MKADEAWFTAGSAAALSGLSLAMVNYLCRTDVVVPSGNEGIRGRGTRRRYSFGDVVALRLVARLSARGVQPLRVARSLKALRRLHPEITLTSLPATHVVTDGEHLYLRRPGDPLERALDGQMTFAFIFELSDLQREIASQITRPARRKASTRRG